MNRAERRQLQEAQIVEVARHALVTGGMDGFVLRSIAERCKMQLGNLQYYFPTRDDLLAAITRAEVGRDVEALRAPFGDDPEADLLGRLGSLMERWGASEHNVYVPIGVLALTNERLATAWAEVYRLFYDALADVIAMVDPAASVPERRARAIAITALVDGAGLQPADAAALEPRVVRDRLLAEAHRIALGSVRPELRVGPDDT